MCNDFSADFTHCQGHLSCPVGRGEKDAVAGPLYRQQSLLLKVF